LVSPKEGKIEKTEEILKRLADQKTYGEWLERYLKRLKDFVKYQAIDIEEDKELIRKQVAFGYTQEEIKNVLSYMAEEGKELTFSMGDDAPIPPLSEKPVLLFRYFKQRFAQVTNPPHRPNKGKGGNVLTYELRLQEELSQRNSRACKEVSNT
jgi:hypothetical protein